MRTTLPWAVALWLAAGSAAASCDPSAAAAVVERYLAAVQSPTDCTREMARLLDIAEDDVRECPAYSTVPSRVEFEAEFLRRTSARFVRLREADGGWVADIAFRGPDPEAVQMVALTRSPFCPQAGAADAEAGESMGLWTEYRPEGLSCDPVDWDAFPVVEEQGALPMACRAGRWVPSPPPELASHRSVPFATSPAFRTARRGESRPVEVVDPSGIFAPDLVATHVLEREVLTLEQGGRTERDRHCLDP